MRKKLLTIATAAALATGTVGTEALAHTGHNVTFALHDGIVHPFAGADHLFAMLAVGIWAAQLGGRALFALPAAFVAAMVVGALAAHSGFATGGTESVIVGSVVVLGGAIALKLDLGLAASIAVAALFALAHGQAHGLEIPTGTGVAAYVGGFAIATAALHASGIVAGRLLARAPALVRALGVAISAAGVAMASV
ncbi:MAG: HupE/UreJ family protein [Hyphomicrobiaceae bacterium]|nr:HupE/UreJ family protein [Hyphomicrobiaceae bacterium]